MRILQGLWEKIARPHFIIPFTLIDVVVGVVSGIMQIINSKSDLHLEGIFIITICLLVVFLIFLLLLEKKDRKKENEDRKKENDRAIEGYAKILKLYIKNRIIQFYSIKWHCDPPSTMRISIYTNYKEWNIQIARYSFHREYDSEDTKPHLQKEESGAVGIAWKTGKCDIKVKSNPAIDPDAYKRELMDDWNMSKEHVDNLSMKSRRLKGKRLTGVRETDDKKEIGVILIESTKKCFDCKEEEIFEILSEDEDMLINNIVAFYERQL